MDEAELKVRLYSKGTRFAHGTTLDDTIQILTHFNNIFTHCLALSEKKYAKGEQFILKPRLNVEYVKRSSFDSLLTVDMPMAYALIAPLIQENTWELFKNSFGFVQAYIGHILEKREPPQVKIENSPGSVNIVNISQGNMTIGSDAYKIGTKHLDDIGHIAQIVEGDRSFVDIKRIGNGNKILDEIRIDSHNREQFVSQVREFEEDSPEEIKCKIYSMNLRSGKGRLDLIDGNDIRPIPFEIEGGTDDDYIDAMKEDSIIAYARKKFKVNSLGESKIDYLFVSGIKSP